MSKDARRKQEVAALPAFVTTLEQLQDDIRVRMRELPGPLMDYLREAFDAFDANFSLAPIIQGLLVCAASLGKKRQLIFLCEGSASKPFTRYMAVWMTCIGERNNAKSFIEDLTGVPMLMEVSAFYKNSRSKGLRAMAEHLNGLDDGSSADYSNDSSTTHIYATSGKNERLNSWTTVTDEADTFFSRLEDGASSSEARYYTTSWDAGRRLSKSDSVTDTVTARWQHSMFLLMQPQIKIREVTFEQEQKQIGVALRSVASTYRKPHQGWEASADYEAAAAYREFASKRRRILNPLKELFFFLLQAVITCATMYPEDAIAAHPGGVTTSNTPKGARRQMRRERAAASAGRAASSDPGSAEEGTPAGSAAEGAEAVPAQGGEAAGEAAPAELAREPEVDPNDELAVMMAEKRRKAAAK